MARSDSNCHLRHQRRQFSLLCLLEPATELLNLNLLSLMKKGTHYFSYIRKLDAWNLDWFILKCLWQRSLLFHWTVDSSADMWIEVVVSLQFHSHSRVVFGLVDLPVDVRELVTPWTSFVRQTTQSSLPCALQFYASLIYTFLIIQKGEICYRNRGSAFFSESVFSLFPRDFGVRVFVLIVSVFTSHLPFIQQLGCRFLLNALRVWLLLFALISC